MSLLLSRNSWSKAVNANRSFCLGVRMQEDSERWSSDLEPLLRQATKKGRANRSRPGLPMASGMAARTLELPGPPTRVRCIAGPGTDDSGRLTGHSDTKRFMEQADVSGTD